MKSLDEINPYVDQFDYTIPLTDQSKSRLISLLDYTSLNDNDSEESMAVFLDRAMTPLGPVASVCVSPQFVSMAKSSVKNSYTKIGTVANFPKGTTPLETVLIEINDALEDGADEIDLVFPYQDYLKGQKEKACQFVMSAKAACGKNVTLKIILETGLIEHLDMLAEMSETVILAGADFIKTSTGKVSKGATPFALSVMLLVAQELTPKLNRKIGVKASGGIKNIEEALQYIALADKIIPGKAARETFRIGASKIMDELFSWSHS